MKNFGVAAWLLSLLLVIGQQGGLLHHLGHELDSAQRVITHGVDESAQAGTRPADRDEGHAACLLCVGFGGGTLASAEFASDRFATSYSFARPYAATPHRRPSFLRGAPIRGPPAGFSADV